MRKIVVGGIAVALGVSTAVAGGAFAAGGQPQQWVNGGGQVIADSSNSGPGQTIAFNVQKLADGVRGQVQQNDHAGVKWHSTSIICAAFQDNTAEFAGTTNDPDEQYFEVFVTDSGQGNQGTDMVTVTNPTDTPDCSEDAPDQQLTLARGNVTIHNR